jgi:hypothetical protein
MAALAYRPIWRGCIRIRPILNGWFNIQTNFKWLHSHTDQFDVAAFSYRPILNGCIRIQTNLTWLHSHKDQFDVAVFVLISFINKVSCRCCIHYKMMYLGSIPVPANIPLVNIHYCSIHLCKLNPRRKLQFYHTITSFLVSSFRIARTDVSRENEYLIK